MKLFGQLLIILVVAVVMMEWARQPVANPGAVMNPLFVIGFLVVAVVWIGGILARHVNFWGVLLAFAVGAALLWLSGTGALPVVDNPCPGDEVIVVVGGKCVGMDVDANRAWVEGQGQR